jgi:FimV-like protein
MPIPKTKMNVCALLSGSSEGASLPTAVPTECHAAGIDLNKNISSAYPYTYLRGRPLHERRAGGREMLSQLDLARAYQEMGDKDAALQVLREVIRDGDAGQRERARRILANLNP